MRIVGRQYLTGEPVELEIQAGAVQSLRPAPPGTTGPGGPWIAPGLVDLQVNGCEGIEFTSRELQPEHLEQVAHYLARGGVTQFCPTLTTADFETLRHALEVVDATCRRSAELTRRVLGVHLEGPYISPEDGPRGAHPVAHCRPPDEQEFARLQEAAGGRIVLVTLAAEYAGADRFIARLAAAGIVPALGHTAATDAQIRRAVDAGARLSTHLGNGCHLLLPRHPNYLWSQLADDRLSISLIADGQHLPPEVVRAMIRAKGVERVILVSDLAGAAGRPPGRYASGLGLVDVLPDGRLVKAGQDQLLAGASRPLCTGVANLQRWGGVRWSTAIDMASRHPLALLGRPAGRVLAGDPADLVLLEGDPQDGAEACIVRATICGGRPVYQA
jgi:N-acetylglucosamine-6-phosphate deacetylase